MPVEKIVHQLALIEKQVMPGATIYENVPESIQSTPSVVNWLAGGTLPFGSRDVTYNVTHNIDVRVFFSRADAPSTDRIIKPYIEQMRVAIDKDTALGGTAHISGVTGYKYGKGSYANVDYFMLSITVQAIEKVVAGEVSS